MSLFSRLDIVFFNTVQYDADFEDNSWLSKVEAAADVCRAPSQWLAAELWSGGKKYIVTKPDSNKMSDFDDGVCCNEVKPKVTQGMQKVIRIGLGLFLSLPGQILALPLMGIAYAASKEIFLKHKISVRKLSEEEQKELVELIQKRQELAKERQGCEPNCLLCTICCLLCYLVCSK
jgi:hypothetical protein